MAKVITWVKKHAYQWEREDYRKVCNSVMLGMVITVVGLILTMLLFEQFGWSENKRLVALIIWYLFLGLTFGSGWAIKWADMKLKNTRSETLGGE